jgi:RNA polymerase sigma-70 factor (ECF subfamily)
VPVALDGVALDQIVRRQMPQVERLLLRILGPREDLEDLVQTVFLELCRALPRYRGSAPLSTFIGGITVRVARRAMRPPAFFRRRGPMTEEPTAIGTDPERTVTDQERMRRLRTALAKIGPKKRIAFALWAFDGMAVEEIAAVMGSTVAATRSRIHHAQRELRALAKRDPWLREALEGEGP